MRTVDTAATPLILGDRELDRSAFRTAGDWQTGGMKPVAEVPDAGRGGCAGQRVAARVVGLFAADARR
jgi:hypothetical protein